MKKRVSLVIAVFVVLCCISSCLGAVSLEKYGYVITLGIDKGKTCRYSFSFLMESDSGAGEQDSAPKANITTVDGDNVFDAIYTAESALPFRLNFSRTSYIVIGFDVAADDELPELFSVSWSRLRIRTSANLIISGSTAQEFLDGLSYTDEVNIAKLESSLVDFYERDGLTSQMSISEFLYAVKSARLDPVLPYGAVDTSAGDEGGSDTTDGKERKGGMVSYTLGSALFSGSALCGVISSRESRTLMLTEGKAKGSVIQFDRDDGTNYSVEVSNVGKPKVRVDFENDSIRVRYTINISVTLRQDSEINHAEKEQGRGEISKDMKEQIKEYLESACRSVFEECRELNCDALGLGRYVSMKFNSVKEWESFNFKSRLQNTECDFDVNIVLESASLPTLFE